MKKKSFESVYKVPASINGWSTFLVGSGTPNWLHTVGEMRATSRRLNSGKTALVATDWTRIDYLTGLQKQLRFLVFACSSANADFLPSSALKVYRFLDSSRKSVNRTSITVATLTSTGVTVTITGTATQVTSRFRRTMLIDSILDWNTSADVETLIVRL